MNSAEFNLNFLINNLNFKKLPGPIAQNAMAPSFRQKLVEEMMSKTSIHKKAAVLILLYENENKIFFPVIHRNSYPGTHSDQIGLPGGKIEFTDKTIEDTAIRETKEEIKANASSIQIIGKLTDLFIPMSNFIVHPFVGYYREKANFSPSFDEVKKIIPLPLHHFLVNPPISNFHVNAKYDVPCFQIEGSIPIWGATAMILNEFLVLIKNSLNLN